MTLQAAPIQYEQVVLKGGLDQITPTLSLPSGFVKDSVNFECAVTGGYGRIAGYERLDGRSKPSNATYQIIQVTSFVNTPTTGQTLTGDTSGATGVIIALGSNYIAVTKVTGVFSATEVVKVGLTTIGTCEMPSVSISSLLDAQYTNLAADVYRNDIQPVPGSGPIRDVFTYNDEHYALRDNVGGTAVDLYKATPTGWSQITFFNEVVFSAGNVAEPADGETLTQGGVTATVKRCMTSSGAWTGSAQGRLVVTNPSGGNFAAGAATLSGGGTVTLAGAQTAITLTPGGKFVFDFGNFYGSASTIRMYGADGVNNGIEFDGTTLCKIRTGSTDDRPKYVSVHKNHLFWAIRSSLVHSAPGLPYNYDATVFAGEIAVGDTITGLLVQPGAQTTAALAVLCRNLIALLYGTGSNDWNLATYNQGVGALDYTAQNMSQSFFLDDCGVMSLATSLNYGNFEHSSLTNNIKTLIVDKRSKVACSVVNREKSQYRLFFNDGYGLYITIVNGQLMGSMPVYTADTFYSAYEGELSNGNEVALLGSEDSGYVYESDVGSSFDGGAIDAFFNLNWNFANSPRIRKRFRRASLEMQGSHFADIGFGYQISYGTDYVEQPGIKTYESSFSGTPRWDNFTWDNFIWDGRTLTPTECEMVGTGENVQFVLTCSTDYIMPFVINSVIYHYSPRRAMR